MIKNLFIDALTCILYFPVKCSFSDFVYLGYRIFRRYDRKLAEEREEELQKFVSVILNGDPKVKYTTYIYYLPLSDIIKDRFKKDKKYFPCFISIINISS